MVDGEENRNHQEERRLHLRTPITVIRARLDDGPKTFFGYARDLSRGGLGIHTLRPKELGSQHDLEFSLPEPLGLTVRCRCEVAWTRPYVKDCPEASGMGLRFLDVPEHVAAVIDEWIRGEERSPRFKKKIVG